VFNRHTFQCDLNLFECQQPPATNNQDNTQLTKGEKDLVFPIRNTSVCEYDKVMDVHRKGKPIGYKINLEQQ